MKKRNFEAFLLAIIFSFGLAACSSEVLQPSDSAETIETEGENKADQTDTVTVEESSDEVTVGETESELSPEEQILAERREKVVSYMQNMVTLLWRAEKDVDYQLASGYDMQIKAGRIYSGLPYTNACGSVESFIEGAGEPDAKGIYTIPGDMYNLVNGTSLEATMGNDCSAAVFLAYAQIGASVTSSAPQCMYDDYGFVKVGEYKIRTFLNDFGNPRLDFTIEICEENGKDVMYEAYAKLQKGDMVTHILKSGNHVAMIAEVQVAYGDDGKIHETKSRVKVIDQTRTNQVNESSYMDDELGENVYRIGKTAHTWTFKDLYTNGYLPYTCKELIDPSPLPMAVVNDTETEHSLETLFTGTISSNWAIDMVTLTIKDNTDKVVQEVTGRSLRGSWNIEGGVGEKQREFDLQRFVTDAPDTFVGAADPAKLPAGDYRCTVTCRLMGGQEFVVRDFKFSK